MKNHVISFLLTFLSVFPLNMKAADEPAQQRRNLVCLVRFADEQETVFAHSGSFYENLFNSADVNANSVYQYFLQASYGQLEWKSGLFPSASASDKIISLQLSTDRAYYQPYSELTNPDGYKDALTSISREQGMVKEIVTKLSEQLPEAVLTDGNGDDIVDNLCIVLSGYSDLSSKYMLWPHRSMLQLTSVPTIHGKRVTEYLMLFDEANGFDFVTPIEINTGVICHEMSHALGTYDLYHATKGLNPVGVWDLMSDNLLVPQHMSAYTKYKYLHWIKDIPQISEPGVYTLNPVGGSTKQNLAYKIKPTGSDEYFVVEYRRKEGTFDGGLPGSGLLVYRINPNATGNENYNGVDRFDEVYIFRPGGTTTADGNILNACFSQESGRTSFGGTADQKPFYTNGKEAKFALTNISSCGETLSFELLPLEPQLYLHKHEVALAGLSGSSIQLSLEADLAWHIVSQPEWLSVSATTGTAGMATVRLTANSDNQTSDPRIGKLVFGFVDQPQVKDTVYVTQNSSLIQPPTELVASKEENTVVLNWTAPFEGAPLLSDGFEDISNPNNWTIRNEHNCGWNWCANAKYVPSYSGNFSMRAKDDWDEQHQDEWLISPAFAHGKTLVFYSKSVAVGKNNVYNGYFVEVSTDDGQNWTRVWNLMTDGTQINKYEKVVIDLSAYQSEQMKIAFHAFDTDLEGHKYLSYPWFVDDVTIYPAVESQITGYRIYRNGEAIGTSQECRFVDASPVGGEATYQVSAMGDFGETLLSESVVYSYDGPSALTSLSGNNLRVWKRGEQLYVSVTGESLSPVHVQVLSVTGELIWQGPLSSEVLPLSLSDGVYIVRVEIDGQMKSFKVM